MKSAASPQQDRLAEALRLTRLFGQAAIERQGNAEEMDKIMKDSRHSRCISNQPYTRLDIK